MKKMKIAPSKIATTLAGEPVNRPRESAALKPLAEADFARQLQMAVGGSETEKHQSSLRPLSAIEMVPGVKGPVKPLKELNPPIPPLMPLGDSPFSLGHPKEPKTEHEKIQETARKWVAQTFFGTMLKQMRESPFKSELFSGGRGGQAFSTLLDQHLADHMSRAAGSKLVNAIARKIEARAGYPKQVSPKPPGTLDNPNQMRMHVAPSLRA
jgi:hypothetical protein